MLEAVYAPYHRARAAEHYAVARRADDPGDAVDRAGQVFRVYCQQERKPAAEHSAEGQWVASSDSLLRQSWFGDWCYRQVLELRCGAGSAPAEGRRERKLNPVLCHEHVNPKAFGFHFTLNRYRQKYWRRVKALTEINPAANQVNLATDPTYKEKLAEMESLLHSEMKRLNDPYRLWDQPED